MYAYLRKNKEKARKLEKIEVYKACIYNHLWKKVGRRILSLEVIFSYLIK